MKNCKISLFGIKTFNEISQFARKEFLIESVLPLLEQSPRGQNATVKHTNT